MNLTSIGQIFNLTFKIIDVKFEHPHTVKIAKKRKKVYRRNKSEQSQQLFLLVNAFHVKLSPVFKF